ncbi:hypothetical protein [Aromatoleum diolicum]|uniref:Uncharacterized protein n=1 Tax=Aromatoleum diolicum TaxID=75796 RepID=A0ABX1QE90_9RHOO|nr:hypothetical protein [Aromatoleum diolicum]NMG76243.1 hypothetical protein [Aromatoleum diolicum]
MKNARSAGARQVEGARLALQRNLGLGGACVVTKALTLEGLDVLVLEKYSLPRYKT